MRWDFHWWKQTFVPFYVANKTKLDDLFTSSRNLNFRIGKYQPTILIHFECLIESILFACTFTCWPKRLVQTQTLVHSICLCVIIDVFDSCVLMTIHIRQWEDVQIFGLIGIMLGDELIKPITFTFCKAKFAEYPYFGCCSSRFQFIIGTACRKWSTVKNFRCTCFLAEKGHVVHLHIGIGATNKSYCNRWLLVGKKLLPNNWVLTCMVKNASIVLSFRWSRLLHCEKILKDVQ